MDIYAINSGRKGVYDADWLGYFALRFKTGHVYIAVNATFNMRVQSITESLIILPCVSSQVACVLYLSFSHSVKLTFTATHKVESLHSLKDKDLHIHTWFISYWLPSPSMCLFLIHGKVFQVNAHNSKPRSSPWSYLGGRTRGQHPPSGKISLEILRTAAATVRTSQLQSNYTLLPSIVPNCRLIKGDQS